MVRIRNLVSLAVVAGITALPMPVQAENGDCRLIRGTATPEDPSDDVQVCRQDNWFHRGGAPLANLATAPGSLPAWSTTAPTSFNSGAGGAYATTSVFHQGVAAHDPRGTPTFEGIFTGNIDNLAVDMFLSLPARSAAANHAVNFDLSIDGEVVYQTADVPDRPALQDTSMTGVRRIQFAFRNVYSALEAPDLDDPAAQHTVRLAIAPWFLVDDNGTYLFDATEVPSGIIFNLEAAKLGPYTKFDVSV